MKPSPGNAFVWLLLSLTTLFGQVPYEWSVTASKSDVVVNEAVELHYTCSFSDDASLYTIEFKPPKQSDTHRLYMLSEKERIRSGIRTNEFHFLYFPKHSGDQRIDFLAMMRRTTKASIENTVIGRDNVEDIDFIDTKINLPSILLDVSPVDAGLVGRFSLDTHLNQEKVRAFEPLHLTVNVEGEGNFDDFTPFFVEIPGVQVFAEAAEKKYVLSEDGFRGRWTQRFALVAEEDFHLDAFELSYYDLDERRVKKLSSDVKDIVVEKAHKVEELLDTEDEEQAAAWRWDWSYLNYLLTFMSGWVIGRWWRSRPSESEHDESLVGKIKNSKSPKALAVVLVLSGDERFIPLISRLERASDVNDLVKAKREALLFVDAQKEWDVPVLKKGLVNRALQIFFLMITQIIKIAGTLLQTLLALVKKR